MKVKSLSRVRLFATPWPAAYQAPPSMKDFLGKVLEWAAIAFSDTDTTQYKIHLMLKLQYFG